MWCCTGVIMLQQNPFSQEAQEEILSNKTRNISNLKRAYHNASNPAFKTMWLKKLYQLTGNNGKK